ncbi:unnamed protein product [Ectocarpus sp. CCAP 1310/34]|nr:unnamed protein product [Ectocarpus sp. CCAP 1310/34]
MPCAEGELCLQQDRTPQPPHGHPCKGGCGGRLHGNCGSVFEDNGQNRICSTCVARTSKRKATPAKGAGAGPFKRQKQTSGGSKKGTGSRARLDNNKKLEILKMLDQKVSHAQIADRFKCSLRLIETVKAGRQKVETGTAAGCGSQKSARKGDFPEVRYMQCCDDEEDKQDQGGGEDSGNGDAAFYLTKATMSMIAAHSARRVRQTDIRGFVAT